MQILLLFNIFNASMSVIHQLVYIIEIVKDIYNPKIIYYSMFLSAVTFATYK